MKKARNRILLILVMAACVALMLPGVCASAENIGTYPVGVEMGWIQFYESGLPIINCVPYSGGLPSDVEMCTSGRCAYVPVDYEHLDPVMEVQGLTGYGFKDISFNYGSYGQFHIVGEKFYIFFLGIYKDAFKDRQCCF